MIYGSLETLSGGYFYDRKLVEFLRAQGDNVQIISLPPGLPNRADWHNYAAHLGDNLRFRLPPGLDLLIQDELNHPSLLAANRTKPYPIISLVHHLRCSELHPAWQNICYRAIERSYLRSVDGFIFNSQTTRNVVTALAGDKKPAIVAYPPTDRFGAALPEAFVCARAAEPGPLRLVFVGNIIPRKGLHTLLEAIRRCQFALQLDVVGSLSVDPGYAKKMQDRTAAIAKSKIEFHNSLDDMSLIEMLKSAHLLVVPSSYEGFGIVYLEGMACGLPAIGTTAGAASEIIHEGETGFLTPPEDAETLAARLDALSTNRPLLTRLSLSALERYRRQPTWQQTAGEIRQFLKHFLTQQSTA